MYLKKFKISIDKPEPHYSRAGDVYCCQFTPLGTEEFFMGKEAIGRVENEHHNQLKPLKQVIADDIIYTRQSFLNERPDYEKTQISYNLEMDGQVYKTLYKYRFANSPEYQDARTQLDESTRWQLETLLRERFNVVLSSYRYEIKNNEIYPENGTEPLKNVLIRGMEYRKHHGSNDLEREQAEVDGFVEVIEPVLCADDAQVGSTVLSISPRGGDHSIYQHNFYDVFTLRQDEKGKYIEARRYSSALEPEDYPPKLRELKPSHPTPLFLSDAYFLANPVVLNAGDSKYKTADEIHTFLHKGHRCMSFEEFSAILAESTFCINSYIQSLCHNPYDADKQGLIFDAILNKADEAWRNIERGDRKTGYRHISYEYNERAHWAEIYRLGNQEVRVVATGCGTSGGSNKNSLDIDGVNSLGTFSVSEFGKITKDSEDWFKCPKCNYKADGPVGNNCPGCGLTKENYAKAGNKVC